MTKKLISLLIVSVLLISCFPVPALAAGGTISADGTYDIGSYGNNSVITIEDGHVVTFTNTGGLTLTNVQINCGYGTTLTIDGIKIDDSANPNVCALSFTQYNNKLILMGDSYIKSGNNMPGIKEDSSSELEISGEGSIEVFGGTNAAGIGGVYQSAEMVTRISGGTVKATGGYHGAGIGGGDSNGDLMVVINEGSNVTAQGGDGGAGIGGGYNSTGIVVKISGGDIIAQGGTGGAGIGGGYNSQGGESTIKGDCTVRAFGGLNAAGIGGGQGRPGGILDVQDGLIFAEGNGGYDIGHGAGGNTEEDSFTISGDAAVLLRNGICTEPTTSNHELKVKDPVADHIAFGYNLPESWTKAYAYLKTYFDLMYDSNGGEGTPPETVPGHEGASTAIANGAGLKKESDVFLKWNTQPDGLGTDYLPGASFEFTKDTTLYAIYAAPVRVTGVSLDKESAAMTDGDALKLTATVSPSNASFPEVTWSSDNEGVAAVDAEGNVTAIYPGTATITGAADGISDTCVVTVEPKRVTGVSLSSHAETMTAGDTLAFTATVSPSGATYPEVTWTSSNNAVATVSENGLVTAVGQGNAVITAAADGMSDECSITVNTAQCTVTFNMWYEGAENRSVKVSKGSAVPEPDTPLRAGWIFDAWYTEQDCINEWDFSAAVTNDMTLYAGWTPEGCPFTGRGTQAKPYLITNASDLAQLSALVNAGNANYYDKYYLQTQDLDLLGYSNWAPIGAPGKPFMGTYDGNGKKVAKLNINIDSPKDTVYLGLFGYIEGATIRNVKLEGGNISVSSSASANVGSLAGYTGGGGLIENCSSSADVSAYSLSVIRIGGIIGYASNNSAETSIIKDCVNSGAILGRSTDGANVGGIIGNIEYGVSVSSCANSGNITARYNPAAGGIAGKTNGFGRNLCISQCYNTGDIYADDTSDDGYSGGIAGFSRDTEIANCFNAGTISEESIFHHPSEVGGIAGNASGDSDINACYNVGKIVNDGTYGGGIAGYLPDTEAAINDCYYADTFADYIGVGYGTSYTAYKKTLNELKQQTTYLGYDFDTVWTFAAGYDYPQLRGNPFFVQQHNVAVTADSVMGSVQGSGVYKLFDTVTVTASPNGQYTFKNWVVSSGGAVIDEPSSPTATFVMTNHDVAVNAVFEKKKYTLTIQNDGNGVGYGYGPESAYAWGETVTINARAKDGYQFIRWEVVSGDVEISDEFNMTAEITMPQSDVIIKAVFDVNPTGYDFSITDNKVTIIKYTGTASDIVIPYRINGYPVTAIGDGAFNSKIVLTSVEIPGTITSIGINAFYGCTKIENIKLGNGIISIGNAAFANCQSLNSITLPDSVVSIGNLAFMECKRLKSITIGAGVESIYSSAFAGCTALNGFTVSPDNANYASVDEVLYDKQMKTLVHYPAGRIGTYSVLDGVTSIEDEAFKDCTLLTDVYIPVTVTEIGKLAFCECDNLESITIPDSVVSIGDQAFYLCDVLENVWLGNSVKSIGEYCFYSCDKIKRIEFPESVTVIGDRAFEECNLYEVYCWGYEPEVGTNAFVDNHTYTQAYFHVSHPAYWASLNICTKNIFCLLTLDKKNGEAPETNKAPLNNLKLPAPAAPVRDHYRFEYWCADEACNTRWDFGAAVTGDVTLYAKWTPVNCTVKFDARGGYPADAQTVAYGSNLKTMPRPERAYYVFSGWYATASYSGAPVGPSYTVTQDVTLYAKWEPQGFNIYYYLDGGTATYENPQSYTAESASVTLHNPAKTGYTFTGWTGGGIYEPSKDITIPKGSGGDRVYTAHWTANAYSVAFNSKEGSAIAPLTTIYGSMIPEPPAPSRPGYSFAGWYKESSCQNRWNFGTDRITGNDTLYAKWQPLTYYLDHVEMSAGTLMKPFSKNVNSYSVVLGENEGSFTITPVKEYDGAVMKINNAVRSSYGINVANGKSATIKVSVTYNRKTKTYTFKVTRAKSSNNSLGSLTASAGAFDKPFDPNIQNYTLLLDENTKSVTVSAAAASPAAKASFKSKKLTLKNGQRKTVSITVKAQSGARRTYTITVVRAASSNASLKALKASPGLSPAFSPAVTDYTVTLPAAKGSATISAKPAGYNAAVYIDGLKKSSKKVTVASGQSVTVRVMVLAQSGNTKDYYITVRRP